MSPDDPIAAARGSLKISSEELRAESRREEHAREVARARRTVWVVIRAHGPSWNDAVPLEEQPLWVERAQFMDELVERGVVVLGGPLGGDKAMLLCDAPDEETIHGTFAGDPWSEDMLVTASVERWTIRLEADLTT